MDDQKGPTDRSEEDFLKDIIPYRCPKCGNKKKFETLRELKSHLEKEHSFKMGFVKPRTRLKVFSHRAHGRNNSDDEYRETSNQLSQEVKEDDGRLSSLLTSYQEDARIIEEQLRLAKDAEALNKLQQNGHYRGLDFHEKLSTLNNEVMNSRQSQWRTEDALSKTHDVLGGIEKAAETRCTDQREVIQGLVKNLKDKEEELVNANGLLDKLKNERERLVQETETIFQDAEEGSHTLREELGRRESELDIVSEKLKEVKSLATTEISSRDEELKEASQRVVALEEDRNKLIYETDRLLKQADDNSLLLRKTLQEKELQLEKVNSRFDNLKSEQENLLEESIDLYKEANEGTQKLKGVLRSRDNQLHEACNELERMRGLQKKLLWESQELTNQADQGSKAMKQLLRQKEIQLRNTQNALKRMKLQQKYESSPTDPNGRKVQHSSNADVDLQKAMVVKEQKLEETQKELESLKKFLQTAAQKEIAARDKLEAFISDLIDRADHAERELRFLKAQASSPDEISTASAFSDDRSTQKVATKPEPRTFMRSKQMKPAVRKSAPPVGLAYSPTSSDDVSSSQAGLQNSSYPNMLRSRQSQHITVPKKLSHDIENVPRQYSPKTLTPQIPIRLTEQPVRLTEQPIRLTEQPVITTHDSAISEPALTQTLPSVSQLAIDTTVQTSQPLAYISQSNHSNLQEHNIAMATATHNNQILSPPVQFLPNAYSSFQGQVPMGMHHTPMAASFSNQIIPQSVHMVQPTVDGFHRGQPTVEGFHRGQPTVEGFHRGQPTVEGFHRGQMPVPMVMSPMHMVPPSYEDLQVRHVPIQPFQNTMVKSSNNPTMTSQRACFPPRPVSPAELFSTNPHFMPYSSVHTAPHRRQPVRMQYKHPSHQFFDETSDMDGYYDDSEGQYIPLERDHQRTRRKYRGPSKRQRYHLSNLSPSHKVQRNSKYGLPGKSLPVYESSENGYLENGETMDMNELIDENGIMWDDPDKLSYSSHINALLATPSDSDIDNMQGQGLSFCEQNQPSEQDREALHSHHNSKTNSVRNQLFETAGKYSSSTVAVVDGCPHNVRLNGDNKTVVLPSTRTSLENIRDDFHRRRSTQKSESELSTEPVSDKKQLESIENGLTQQRIEEISSDTSIATVDKTKPLGTIAGAGDKAETKVRVEEKRAHTHSHMPNIFKNSPNRVHPVMSAEDDSLNKIHYDPFCVQSEPVIQNSSQNENTKMSKRRESFNVGENIEQPVEFKKVGKPSQIKSADGFHSDISNSKSLPDAIKQTDKTDNLCKQASVSPRSASSSPKSDCRGSDSSSHRCGARKNYSDGVGIINIHDSDSRNGNISSPQEKHTRNLTSVHKNIEKKQKYNVTEQNDKSTDVGAVFGSSNEKGINKHTGYGAIFEPTNRKLSENYTGHGAIIGPTNRKLSENYAWYGARKSSDDYTDISSLLIPLDRRQSESYSNTSAPIQLSKRRNTIQYTGGETTGGETTGEYSDTRGSKVKASKAQFEKINDRNDKKRRSEEAIDIRNSKLKSNSRSINKKEDPLYADVDMLLGSSNRKSSIAMQPSGALEQRNWENRQKQEDKRSKGDSSKSKKDVELELVERPQRDSDVYSDSSLGRDSNHTILKKKDKHRDSNMDVEERDTSVRSRPTHSKSSKDHIVWDDEPIDWQEFPENRQIEEQPSRRKSRQDLSKIYVGNSHSTNTGLKKSVKDDGILKRKESKSDILEKRSERVSSKQPPPKKPPRDSKSLQKALAEEASAFIVKSGKSYVTVDRDIVDTAVYISSSDDLEYDTSSLEYPDGVTPQMKKKPESVGEEKLSPARDVREVNTYLLTDGVRNGHTRGRHSLNGDMKDDLEYDTSSLEYPDGMTPQIKKKSESVGEGKRSPTQDVREVKRNHYTDGVRNGNKSQKHSLKGDMTDGTDIHNCDVNSEKYQLNDHLGYKRHFARSERDAQSSNSKSHDSDVSDFRTDKNVDDIVIEQVCEQLPSKQQIVESTNHAPESIQTIQSGNREIPPSLSEKHVKIHSMDSDMDFALQDYGINRRASQLYDTDIDSMVDSEKSTTNSSYSHDKIAVRKFSASGSSIADSYLESFPKSERLEVKHRRKSLLCVFKYLNHKTLAKVALVCREWKAISRNSSLWINVELKFGQMSSKYLETISDWTSQMKTLTLEGLRPRSRHSNETQDEYVDKTRASLEPGLEQLLKKSESTLISLNIFDCGIILTERCLWAASGYSRMLKHLTYMSDTDPVAPEVLWALGAGCGDIKSLVIPPLFPCQKPHRFNNQCLQVIAQCCPDLEVLGIGGKQIDIKGFTQIAKCCQRLCGIELHHMSVITEEIVKSMCSVGLHSLTDLKLIHTSIEVKAIEHLSNCCKLKTLDLNFKFSDCYEESSRDNLKKYDKNLKDIQEIQKKTTVGTFLKLTAEEVEVPEFKFGFFGF